MLIHFYLRDPAPEEKIGTYEITEDETGSRITLGYLPGRSWSPPDLRLLGVTFKNIVIEAEGSSAENGIYNYPPCHATVDPDGLIRAEAPTLNVVHDFFNKVFQGEIEPTATLAAIPQAA